MLRPTRALLVALAIGSTTAIAQNQGDPPPSPNLPPGFSAPEMAGRYLRGQVRDYGNATLGVAYQYDSPLGARDSSFATLYLYRRDSDERGLSSDSVLAMEATAFKQSLAIMHERGDYDDYHIIAEGRDSVAMKDGWKIPGYRVAYTYRRKSVPAISFFYIYVVDDALLKVRATAAASKEKTTDLPDFARDVVEQAARNAPHH